MSSKEFNPTFNDIQAKILARESLGREILAFRVQTVRDQMQLLKLTISPSKPHKKLLETYEYLESMVSRMVFDRSVFEDILTDLETRLQDELAKLQD